MILRAKRPGYCAIYGAEKRPVGKQNRSPAGSFCGIVLTRYSCFSTMKPLYPSVFSFASSASALAF